MHISNTWLGIFGMGALGIGIAAAVAGSSVAQGQNATQKPAFDKALFAPGAQTRTQPARETKVASRVASAAPGPAQAAAPVVAAWRSHCNSASRQTVPECMVEQTAILGKTGQMLASVSVRVPPSGSQPVMMVQVPVGLFLPAGINVRIDEQPPLQLVIQTCDLKGCYAGSPVSADMLKAMKAGKQLGVEFQNLSKQAITVPLTLTQFAEAYRSIQ
ncbi:MAG: invasion associated locus B family protein [Pseudolabrys sp.]